MVGGGTRNVQRAPIYIYPQSLNKLAVCKLVKSVWGKPTINDFLTFFKFTSVGFPGPKTRECHGFETNSSPRYDCPSTPGDD